MADLAANLVALSGASANMSPSASSAPAPSDNRKSGFSDALKDARSEQSNDAADPPPARAESPKQLDDRAPASDQAPRAVSKKSGEVSKPGESQKASRADESSDTDAVAEGDADSDPDAETAKLADGQASDSQIKQDAIDLLKAANSEVAVAPVTPSANDASALLAGQVAKALLPPDLAASKAEGDDEPTEHEAAPETAGSERPAAAKFMLPAPIASVATPATTEPSTKEAVAAATTAALTNQAPTLPKEAESKATARSAEFDKAAAVTQAKQPNDAVQSFSDLLDQNAARISDMGDRAGLGVSGARATAVVPGQALPVGAALHEADWGAAMAKRVTWMVGKDVQQAELRLDPPELGRINVRISMVQDQASISFASPHGTVREAVEAALPKLRDMLSEGGYTLANVDVASQFQQRQGEQSGRRNGSAANTSYDEMLDPASAPVVRISADGLIDAYA